MNKRTWRQDAQTGKLVETTTLQRPNNDSDFHIIGSFDSFVSPVDGTVISTHKQLREHNRRNNVTQDSFNDRIAARTKERDNLFGGRYIDPTRKDDIRDAVERCRGEGDIRYQYD